MQLDQVLLFGAVVTAFVYSMFESAAMSRWAPWTFKGPRVLTRETPMSVAEGKTPDLVRLVAEDEDFDDLNILVKAVEQDSYLVGVPWNSRESMDKTLLFAFISGRMVVDRENGVLRLQLHMMPGSCSTVFIGVGGSLLSACLGGDSAFALFGFLLSSAFLYGAFVVLFKRRMEGFWFLLTMKLKELGY